MLNDKKILIAILKDTKDYSILLNYSWYRIPKNRARTPKMIVDRSIDYIAFYQGLKFKSAAFQIESYAKVDNISIVKRIDLFPDEIINEKSFNDYYKIQIGELLKLDRPILSKKRRIIIFINSTLEKFYNAQEINDLYLGSPLEEKMWNSLKKNMITAEREFHQKIKDQNYFIDFALFCKDINLALECDGDLYHLEEQDVKYDKRRDNMLKSKGWNVLRYTSNDINNNIDNVIYQVKESINYYGGLMKEDKVTYYQTKFPDENQTELF